MKTQQPRTIRLPECGIFIGTGIYPMSRDYLLSTLHAHQSWAPQTFSPLEMVRKIIEDNQGNLAQVWGSARGYAPAMLAEWIYALDEIGVQLPEPDWEKGRYLRPQDCHEFIEFANRRGAGLLRFAREAAEKGLYTTFIYTDAAPEWSHRLAELGDAYLGYDFGERYTYNLEDSSLKDCDLKHVTLRILADDLIRRVREHVDQRRAAGWGNIMATSSNFHLDYEIVAGTDIPVVEDFAFRHLNMASALSRGLYRQHKLPLWGSHLAHEHYSWLPYRSPHKFPLLRAALYQKYMAGSKMIINESGNWFVEASLCEDSPKFDMPRVDLKPTEVTWGGSEPPKFAPWIPEARRHFHKINYDAPPSRKYRETISDFYDFVKANGTPAGQPAVTVAIAKGNLDLCGHTFHQSQAIAGMYALAARNPAWFEGAPERGWNIIKDVFYPLPPVLTPYPNHFLSGTPHGMVDIVSFASDEIDAEVLINHYKALIFAGWNTCSEQQYNILKSFVMAGGTLFLAIPHLSTNDRREYGAYGVSELVHGGDVSDLCGVRIRGRGERFYWATAPLGSTELGFAFPRRFGIMATCQGDIEITDPAVETLVVDDEMARPVLLRRRCGEGSVYFLNSWAYPGAMNTDEGPGGRIDSKGLIGTIFQHIAVQCRGETWITDDGVAPGADCDCVCWSYFPESAHLCLLNVDFEKSHCIHLHHRGDVTPLELTPGEFRLEPCRKEPQL